MHVFPFCYVKPFVKLTPLIGLLVVYTLSADTGLDGILSKLEDHYNRTKTLQVQFVEQYTPPGSIRRTESGTLMLRKPGKMRGEYAQPQGKLFISDGKSLWLYTPDDKHAQKMPLKNTEDLRAPLAFLLGKLHFTKEFQNLQAKPEGSLTRITAQPKGENLPYSNVEFVVTPEDRIQELKVIGFDRSVLDFTFQGEKDDPPLDSKLFQFQLPPGAVLEETAQ
jgi:outer membrane lipoprotein carrier protein